MTTSQTTREKTPMTPAEVGFMEKLYRDSMEWTQETLAELAGLTPRTVQRVEAGDPSSIDTRPALARTFKIPDMDIFLKPNPFPTSEEVAEQKAQFERDHIVLDAKIVSGRNITAMFASSNSYHALAATGLVELPQEAQDAFASITDFARDCMDVADVASNRDMLEYGDQLNEFIGELKNTGYCLAAAIRHTSLTSDSWADKKPLPWTILYLLAAPVDRPPSKIAIPKKISGVGFYGKAFPCLQTAPQGRSPSPHLRGTPPQRPVVEMITIEAIIEFAIAPT